MEQSDDRFFLSTRVRLPEHVAHRSFAAETVVLNVNTGQYHGLNETAGRMLDILQDVGSVKAAAEQISSEYGIPLTTAENDLCALCAGLAERGLVEVESDEEQGPEHGVAPG